MQEEVILEEDKALDEIQIIASKSNLIRAVGSKRKLFFFLEDNSS